MKSRKHVLKIAAFFAVVAMLLGCTISTWARDIKKNYRVTVGNDRTISLKLDAGETISKVKVNKKGLKLKVSKSYNETTIVDKKRAEEYNKTADKDNKVEEYRTVELIAFATKAGKYKVTFDIKKGKKTVKRKQKITVYVTNGSPIKSVKFGGKKYTLLGKYQGSKYRDPFETHTSFVTKKSKGKLSVTTNPGYKVVAIVHSQYGKNGYEKEVKGASVNLYTSKTETESDVREYRGTKYVWKNVDNTAVAYFTVYLKDTWFPENNNSTSSLFKGKYSEIEEITFVKYK